MEHLRESSKSPEPTEERRKDEKVVEEYMLCSRTPTVKTERQLEKKYMHSTTPTVQMEPEPMRKSSKSPEVKLLEAENEALRKQLNDLAKRLSLSDKMKVYPGVWVWLVSRHV